MCDYSKEEEPLGDVEAQTLGTLVFSVVYLLTVVHSYHRPKATEPTIFRIYELMGQNEFSSSEAVYDRHLTTRMGKVTRL